MKFVIIGGDAAGMSAASKAKRNDPSIGVVVLEQTTDVSYSACGLPYNIAEPERDMNDLVVRPAHVFRDKQGIDLKLGHRAERIDRDRRTVSGRTADGDPFEVYYDKLLIATGARPRMLKIPGENLPSVKVLRSLEDGRIIKQYMAVNPVKRALIVGAGYIGLEMAEAFHERGVQVEISDILPELLPWLPSEMSGIIRKELEDKGARLHLGTGISKIEESGGRLRVTLDDTMLEVDLALIGVGVVPNSEIASEAGLAVGPQNSIAVDKTFRTSDPEIFSAGDCADAFHVVTGQRVWIPLALRANRGGWAVADNVTGRQVELPGIVGSAVFKVLDMEVAHTGLSSSEANRAGFDVVEDVIKSRSRAHAHPGNQDIYVHLARG